MVEMVDVDGKDRRPTFGRALLLESLKRTFTHGTRGHWSWVGDIVEEHYEKATDEVLCLL